jgi:hypothetical protein
MRAILLFILFVSFLDAAVLKLYLKDGSFHVVREYQVQGDRVRYFSTERGEWEEIPVALTDLAKTEQERKATEEHSSRQMQQDAEEEKAEREYQREIASIPMEAGAYYKWEEKNKIDLVPSADYQIVTDKKRRALQVLSPIPIVPGKASVVIKGDRAKFSVGEDRPSFYLRLAKEEQFGIVRLTPKKDVRIVENISIVPVAKQAVEDRKQMATFEQQLAPGLYRVWPEKPLTPGEYALIEYADNPEMEDIQLLIWDFAFRPETR